MYRLCGGSGHFFAQKYDFLTLGDMDLSYYEQYRENFDQYSDRIAYPANTSVHSKERQWIPIVKLGEFGMLCIDNSPGEAGTKGQIICAYTSDWTNYRYRLASNMTELVAMILQRMADGKFYLDNDLSFDENQSSNNKNGKERKEKHLVEVLVKALYPESLKM